MVEIKTVGTHPEHYIKIGRREFHTFLLHARREKISTVHLRSDRLNFKRNDSHICVSSEPLIRD